MEEQQETAGKRVPVSSEKLKALQAAMDKIEKSYGRGAIMKLGDDSVEEVAVIPTGSIAFMPKSWVSMWRICGFRSPTVESRRWRLQTS